MVWAGEEEVIYVTHTGIVANYPGFDADAENSAIRDLSIYGIIGKQFTMQVNRSVGSTSTVSVKFQTSLDGIGFTDALTITSATSTSGAIAFKVDYTTASGIPYSYFRFYRITVTTVGSGNTLDVVVGIEG